MIKIIDNTLREGEQVPGLHFSFEEKIEIFDMLQEAGVDLIDVGIPAASDLDARFCAECARRSRSSIPGASIRALVEEVDLAHELGLPEIYIMFPYSEIHVEHKFCTSVAEMKKRCEQVVNRAVALGMKVNVAAEDASRGSLELVCDLADHATKLGVQSIILCDTVGSALPSKFAEMVAAVVDTVARQSEIGIHCHNDHGLATANTLTALDAGATIASVTLNGLGERAGNAPLHEVVLGSVMLLNEKTGVRLEMIERLCSLAERCSGMFISPLAPIIGRNAFRHESGIHVDGLLKNSRIYEQLSPEIVGRKHEITLGKSTGVNYLRRLLKSRDIVLEGNALLKLRDAVREEALGREKNETEGVLKSLEQFYARNLDFPEERFWQIVETTLGIKPDEFSR
jgi:homocitrate synthase NifV